MPDDNNLDAIRSRHKNTNAFKLEFCESDYLIRTKTKRKSRFGQVQLQLFQTSTDTSEGDLKFLLNAHSDIDYLLKEIERLQALLSREEKSG